MFHLNKALTKQSRIIGLFRIKNKEIDADISYEIIT